MASKSRIVSSVLWFSLDLPTLMHAEAFASRRINGLQLKLEVCEVLGFRAFWHFGSGFSRFFVGKHAKFKGPVTANFRELLAFPRFTWHWPVMPQFL